MLNEVPHVIELRTSYIPLFRPPTFSEPFR